MNVLHVILISFLFAGIFGWIMIPFTHCIPWFVSWWEGEEVDWVQKVGLALFVPGAWLFTICEICLLYLP